MQSDLERSRDNYFDHITQVCTHTQTYHTSREREGGGGGREGGREGGGERERLLPALSCGFLSPANIIFVPGMYFLGANKY